MTPSPPSTQNTSTSGPTALGRTARSSASTALSRSSGPTDRSSPPTTNEPQPLHPGSSTTTLNDATQPSEDYRRSADCHEPLSRVHLGADNSEAAGPLWSLPRQLDAPPGPLRSWASRGPQSEGASTA